MKDRARLAALLVLLAATAGTAYMLVPADAPLPAVAFRAGARRATAPKSRADIVEGWKADILARPLIYPGRRAPSLAPALTADNAAPAPVPRLTGVIVSPSGRHALFTAAPGARPVTVDEGERVGPYLVRSIRSNEVVVDGPGGTRSLHPAYENAVPAAEPGPPPLPRHAASDPIQFTHVL
jgi:hypothetical protein